MYTTCIFCHSNLGRNEAIESFPIGRRLAFDAARGRLWAVCRVCRRWNLSPLDERWEAVEACERTFRSARLRASSGEIALARLPEGLDLIRIGKPLRPEFAGWRYGPRLTARHRRALRRGALAGAAALGVGAATAALAGFAAATFGVGAGLGVGFGQLAARASDARRTRERRAAQHARTLGRLRTVDGRPVLLQGGDAPDAKIIERSGDAGWALRLRPDEPVELGGTDAVRALGLLALVVNDAGGTGREVRAAIQAIDHAGGAGAYLRRSTYWGGRFGAPGTLGGQPPVARLALEIAAHEDFERAALEIDLKLLAHAWREAEEIAAIADDLLVPEGVRASLERWRREAGKP